jgi:hypothetical protein
MTDRGDRWQFNSAARCRRTAHRHKSLMIVLISAGVANTTEARSPCIPAPTMTGFPGRGPNALESVFRRRLNSQTLLVLPSGS